MHDNLKFSLVFFTLIFLTATAVNYIEFFVLTKSCDPKLGCMGTFQLVSLVVAVCALVSSIAIYISYFIVLQRNGEIFSRSGRIPILVLALCISVSTRYSFILMEKTSVIAVISLYFFTSLIISGVIYHLKKVNLGNS